MPVQIHNLMPPNGHSHWLLVTLRIARDAEEAASALLFDLGSTGIVTLEESSDLVALGGYFEEKENSNDLKHAIEAEFTRIERPDALHNISISRVPEQDWMQKWKEGFEAISIGERLIVSPSWKLPENSEGRRIIQIDPGMAFGTGTHETTRLCLEAIERWWRGGGLLDVGTGSGILAIAAALLAPGSRVVAIDVDPQAIEVARKNLAINEVDNFVELLEGQPCDLAGQRFDVIVANLTAEVILEAIDDLTRLLSTGGAMILSGILSVLAEKVARALVASGFKVIERRDAGEWSALVAVTI